MGELNKENRAWWFEARLKQVLQYATTWKAVVLLDEADVFLEARQDGGGDAAERNALVAGTYCCAIFRAVRIIILLQCFFDILNTSPELSSLPPTV